MDDSGNKVPLFQQGQEVFVTDGDGVKHRGVVVGMDRVGLYHVGMVDGVLWKNIRPSQITAEPKADVLGPKRPDPFRVRASNDPSVDEPDEDEEDKDDDEDDDDDDDEDAMPGKHAIGDGDTEVMKGGAVAENASASEWRWQPGGDPPADPPKPKMRYPTSEEIAANKPFIPEACGTPLGITALVHHFRSESPEGSAYTCGAAADPGTLATDDCPDVTCPQCREGMVWVGGKKPVIHFAAGYQVGRPYPCGRIAAEGDTCGDDRGEVTCPGCLKALGEAAAYFVGAPGVSGEEVRQATRKIKDQGSRSVAEILQGGLGQLVVGRTLEQQAQREMIRQAHQDVDRPRGHRDLPKVDGRGHVFVSALSPRPAWLDDYATLVERQEQLANDHREQLATDKPHDMHLRTGMDTLCQRSVSGLAFSSDPDKVTCVKCLRALVQRLRDDQGSNLRALVNKYNEVCGDIATALASAKEDKDRGVVEIPTELTDKIFSFVADIR